jgi:hypothetical protein
VPIALFRELSGMINHYHNFLEGGGTVFPRLMDGDEGRFDSWSSSLFISISSKISRGRGMYLQFTIFLLPSLPEGII